MRRCVSSEDDFHGDLHRPTRCWGAFGQMVGPVSAFGSEGTPGPGRNSPESFRALATGGLDFIDGGVLVNCADQLSPDQHSYNIAFRNNLAVLTCRHHTPKPLVLTVKAEWNDRTAPVRSR